MLTKDRSGPTPIVLRAMTNSTRGATTGSQGERSLQLWYFIFLVSSSLPSFKVIFFDLRYIVFGIQTPAQCERDFVLAGSSAVRRRLNKNEMHELAVIESMYPNRANTNQGP
jgi:hypothetical protein